MFIDASGQKTTDFRKGETLRPMLRILSGLLAIFGADVLVLSTIVICSRAWHQPLLRLLFRSWQNFIVSIGTTTLGFVLFEIALPVITFLGTLAISHFIREKGQTRPSLRKPVITAAVAGIATMYILSALLGWNVVRTIHDNHQSLLTANNHLYAENQNLKASAQETEKQAEARHETEKGAAIAKRRAIRDQLGKFLVEAEIMKLGCEHWKQGTPPSKDQVVKWSVAVHSYLAKNLGSSYADQFIGAPSGLPVYPVGVPDECAGILQGLNDRIPVLNKFLDNLN